MSDQMIMLPNCLVLKNGLIRFYTHPIYTFYEPSSSKSKIGHDSIISRLKNWNMLVIWDSIWHATWRGVEIEPLPCILQPSGKISSFS